MRWKGSALAEDPGGDGREAPWRKTQGEMEGKRHRGIIKAYTRPLSCRSPGYIYMYDAFAVAVIPKILYD